MIYKVLVLTLVSQLFTTNVVIADCEINPVADNAPLIIGSGGTDIQYPPHGQSTIKYAADAAVQFVCPGGAVVLQGATTGRPVADAVCISGVRFRVNGERFLWHQVTCTQVPVSVSRFTGQTCTGGRLAETGFNLGDGRFIRQILVCFDTVNQVALYTQYVVIASIGSQATGTPRPLFSEDAGFYNIGTNAVNTLYLRATQRRTINGLLGLAATDTTYIKGDSLYFLSRGHMAARSDFFYPAQQNATFKYINAAPQFQTFNGFNWDQVERDTRDYANRNNVNLQVWTGTYGVTTLPHTSTNAAIPLYIYVNNNVRGIPVPAIYWKVVYNPITRRGVALIGLNNPYESNVSKYVYCNDVSSSLSWLRWDRTNLINGYSYACTIADLRRVVSYIPNLTVTGLLV